jgi:hypothetical protein
MSKPSVHSLTKTVPMIGLSFLTALGCGSSGPSNTTSAVELVAGAMLPRTGPNANSDWVSAVELAVLDMNAAVQQAKMPKPVSFRIEERDTASVEQTAHDVMAEYITLGAKVVVTEASNASIGANKANYDTTATTKLPLVSFTSTSSSLNNPNATDADPVRALALQDPENWFFRTCQISDATAAIRLRTVFGRGTNLDGDVNGDGVVKVVWIGTMDTSTMSSITGDQKAFTTYVNALPTGATPYKAETVLFDPGTDPTTFNYNDAIAKATDIYAADGTTVDGAPDLIINKALPNVAIPFIKAYKQNPQNTTPIFQDGSFRRNTLLAALGSAADGQQGVSNIAFESNASGQLFAMEQQQVTGWPPAAYESQGYDAMALSLLATIKATITAGAPADATPAQVRDALEQMNDPAGELVGTGASEFARAIQDIVAGRAINFQGASGNDDFDAVGNVKDRAVLWTISGGQFVETQVFDCVTDPTCPSVN